MLARLTDQASEAPHLRPSCETASSSLCQPPCPLTAGGCKQTRAKRDVQSQLAMTRTPAVEASGHTYLVAKCHWRLCVVIDWRNVLRPLVGKCDNLHHALCHSLLCGSLRPITFQSCLIACTPAVRVKTERHAISGGLGCSRYL